MSKAQPTVDPRALTWKANLELLAVLLFIVGAIWLAQQVDDAPQSGPTAAPPQALLVTAFNAEPLTQPITLSVTGTSEVETTIRVVPQVSGRVVQVADAFAEGGGFSAESVLFAIDPADYELQRQQALASVEQAQTALTVRESESAAAQAEWDSLNPGTPVPELVLGAPQLAQAKANLKAARAQLRTAELALERTQFRLPFAGHVLSSQLAIGQYISAGQAYAEVYAQAGLRVRAPLAGRWLSWLEPGMTKAEVITADGARLEGVLTRLGNQRDGSTRLVDGFIEAAAEPWTALQPGQFVTVKLRGRAVADVWRVPTSVLQSNGQVWRINTEQRLEPLSVEVLSVEDDMALVKGNGQRAVLVDGLLKGADAGMAVRTEVEMP